MPGSDFAIACEGVGHRFGRQRLFADLNFRVEQPGSVCIAGPNGSGKSTLLKIMVGLLQPERGRVVASEGARTLSPSELRARLGLVSPDLRLYAELTAVENLVFFARLRRQPAQRGTMIDRLAEVGLDAHAEKRTDQLSSGQRQRLKYLAATLHRPWLLLLDEPTSNLDADGRDYVASVVEYQRKNGILIVATNEEEEYAFGDRLVRLVG